MKDRLFSLQWDNSHYKNMSPDMRFRKRNAVGTHYATGYVSLDNGSMFASMNELDHRLRSAGKYKITYHDERAGVTANG